MRNERITAVKMEMERLSTRIAEMEIYRGPRETGAVRRASMDLILALANLRRSDYE